MGVPYKIEEPPIFKGGEKALVKFIQANLNYPQEAITNNISGTCYISFTVELDGTSSNLLVIKGVTNGAVCDKEAMRIITLMPNWTPGKRYGEMVPMNFNLPIKYTLRGH